MKTLILVEVTHSDDAASLVRSLRTLADSFLYRGTVQQLLVSDVTGWLTPNVKAREMSLADSPHRKEKP